MKKFSVRCLVANAFLENSNNKANVDHIDENKANNNVKNLRWATNQDNLYNQGKIKNNTSGYKGVCFHKKIKKYAAHIRINNEC